MTSYGADHWGIDDLHVTHVLLTDGKWYEVGEAFSVRRPGEHATATQYATATQFGWYDDETGDCVGGPVSSIVAVRGDEWA